MTKLTVILKLTKAAVALPLVIALLCPFAFPQDSPESSKKEEQKFTYGAETDFNSVYVWRGIVVNDEPVMQPLAWVSGHGFTFVSSSNLNLTTTPGRRLLDEINLTALYDRDWRKLRIEPALSAYINRPIGLAQDPNTMEGAMTLSYPVGPFRFFTRHSFDLASYRGAYFGEAGARFEKAVSERATLRVSVRSGWASSKFNEVYIGLHKPAFNFVGAGGSLLYYLSPKVFLQPHVEFSTIVDDQLRQSVPRPRLFNFGFSIGFDL